MYKHDLQTQQTKRLITSHGKDIINMLLFTNEAKSSLMMIEFGVVDLDHVPLINYEDAFSESLLLI
jgi:hypothetical protein